MTKKKLALLLFGHSKLKNLKHWDPQVGIVDIDHKLSYENYK